MSMSISISGSMSITGGGRGKAQAITAVVFPQIGTIVAGETIASALSANYDQASNYRSLGRDPGVGIQPFTPVITVNGVVVIDPFKNLMSMLGDGAAQLIAHPLEYGSMFQDRAGTTPVTESGQLVGLVLDHGFTGSAPVPGPELVTNGTFDSADGWVLGDGWTISGGKLRSAEPNNITAANINGSYTAGKTYEIRYEISDYSGGLVRAELQGGGVDSGPSRSSNGVKVERILTTANRSAFRFIALGGTGFTGTIDNISVRELPGYHATAVSDAARGIFREVDGKRWIEYNGVNTAYQTPALPAPGVDKAQVFAGVRKLSDTADAVLVELSPDCNLNNGALGLFAPFGVAPAFGFRSRGSLTSTANQQQGFASPTTNILAGLGDISGDLSTLRIDGTQVTQSTADQGTGNYLNYPIYIGARAGTSLFFNGHHYATLGPIVRFGTNATAGQIDAAEAYYTARAV